MPGIGLMNPVAGEITRASAPTESASELLRGTIVERVALDHWTC